MKRNRLSGFTIAELLIVVAIIAVLVAVSIPVFTSQLEKSREATDLANVRAAYAEVMTAAITEDRASSVYDAFSDEFIQIVYLKQKKDGWSLSADKLNIGGVLHSDTIRWRGDARADGRCIILFNRTRQDVSLVWDGYIVYPDYQWKIVGDKLVKDNVSYNPGTWPASAVPEFIEAKNDSGQKLTVDRITEEYPKLNAWLNRGGGYEIGYFITDSEGKILENSGGKYLKNDASLNFDIITDQVASGTDVKIAVQFFKMNSGTDRSQGSVKMTEEEARELERIFKVQ